MTDHLSDRPLLFGISQSGIPFAEDSRERYRIGYLGIQLGAKVIHQWDQFDFGTEHLDKVALFRAMDAGRHAFSFSGFVSIPISSIDSSIRISK
jgi:hypothetical protein